MDQPNICLQTDNLRKSYKDIVAVDSLSLEIKRGEVFGLLGPNGAGKTTIIKMIAGLLNPDSGKIFINGEKKDGRDNRQLIGLCPQELVLWNNLTCLEQLVFIAEMYNIRSSLALDRANGLLERMGLKEKRNKLVRSLSGGMQRRMNLLMALMHDPEILILDEPEAGLDPQSRVMVREFIHSLARTKTVLFTTHNMDEADRLCDRLAIIDHGKMLVSDTPENLKRKYGKGDKLEIHSSGMPDKKPDFTNLADEIEINDSLMIFKSKAIVDRIPLILESLKTSGLSITGMHLSENTLEDVFISLTGRKLRE